MRCWKRRGRKGRTIARGRPRPFRRRRGRRPSCLTRRSGPPRNRPRPRPNRSPCAAAWRGTACRRSRSSPSPFQKTSQLPPETALARVQVPEAGLTGSSSGRSSACPPRTVSRRKRTKKEKRLTLAVTTMTTLVPSRCHRRSSFPPPRRRTPPGATTPRRPEFPTTRTPGERRRRRSPSTRALLSR